MKLRYLVITSLSFMLLSTSLSSASDEEVPEWKKELQKRIENSMEDLQQQKMGDRFVVTSHKQKGIEFIPGTPVGSDIDVLNVYKDDKLLISIWAGNLTFITLLFNRIMKEL